MIFLFIILGIIFYIGIGCVLYSVFEYLVMIDVILPIKILLIMLPPLSILIIMLHTIITTFTD